MTNFLRGNDCILPSGRIWLIIHHPPTCLKIIKCPHLLPLQKSVKIQVPFELKTWFPYFPEGMPCNYLELNLDGGFHEYTYLYCKVVNLGTLNPPNLLSLMPKGYVITARCKRFADQSISSYWNLWLLINLEHMESFKFQTYCKVELSQLWAE